MLELEFETVPLRKDGKSARYRLIPKVQETWQDETVYAEIIRRGGINMSPDMLKGLFEMVISVTSDLVASDGRPRRIANLKFSPTIKGKVESPYSEFDPETCEAMVRPTVMKGWEKKIDPEKVDIVNTRIGNRVKMAPSSGTCGNGLWEKGVNLDVSGENIQLIEGDEVTVSWQEGEEEKTAAVEVVSTYEYMMTLKFPKELESLPEGTRILLKVKCRGGIEDGVWQTRCRKMTVVEARDTAKA